MGGAREDLIIERRLSEIELPAARPAYSVLGSERAQLLGLLEDALCRYFEDRGETKSADAEEKNISRHYEEERESKEASETLNKECA
jgi:hypothetical protein